MRDVDLSRYRFDYDLTFAVITAHPDGTVYHRYGGRDHRDPSGWLSRPSLLHALEATLEDHEAYLSSPSPPKLRPPRSIADVQPWARRLEKKKVDCVHCHMIHTAERVEAQTQGRWKPRDVWIWPSPERIGLALDRDRQQEVVKIDDVSPASRAGIRVGDRIDKLGSARIATIADIQAVLHDLSWNGGKLPVEVSRNGTRRSLTLELPEGWREGTPLSFSWRAYKWELRPAPGFGGPALKPAEIARLGLPRGTTAFRVSYLVNWGEHAKLGGNAHRAGIRKGDVILTVAGESFRTPDHFHSWFRLTRKVGEVVEVELMRKGERKKLSLEVISD